MKNRLKKTLAFVLVLALCFAVSTTAFAQELTEATEAAEPTAAEAAGEEKDASAPADDTPDDESDAENSAPAEKEELEQPPDVQYTPAIPNYEYEKYYKVTGTEVKLRKAPGTSASIVLTTKKGDIFMRTGSKTTSKNGHTWISVYRLNDGATGYMSMTYMKEIDKPNAGTIERFQVGSGAKLGADFNREKTSYNLYVNKNAASVQLKAKVRWDYKDCAQYRVYIDGKRIDTVYPNKNGTGVFNIALDESAGVIKIRAYVGEEYKTYKFTLNRDQISNCALTSLSLSNAKLSKDFSPSTLKYTCKDATKDTSTTVKLAQYNNESTYTVVVNDKKVSSLKDIPLSIGKNVIKITLISPLGLTATYQITIKREKAPVGTMTALEKKFVEQAFRLLPERHPFVLAYEEAHGVDIKTFSKTINGKRLTGVPFEFGGRANIVGFSSRWWTRTGVSEYPVGGLDCAKYMAWIYKQLGYTVPDDSSTLFLSGKAGVTRNISGVKSHKVIASLKDAKIGDICYNSQSFSYRSGHGSHSAMFLGTARKLGIQDTIKKYYKDFPVDKYLTIDVGWADGDYYYDMMKKIGVSGRRGMCGVGIQFLSSIQDSSGKYVYTSPYRSSKRTYAWKDSKSGETFEVECNIEKHGRKFQHKVGSGTKYMLNISRPIVRTDA